VKHSSNLLTQRVTRSLYGSWASCDKSGREYLLVSTDDLIRFWRSKVKVTACCRGSEGLHVDAVTSTSIFWLFLHCVHMFRNTLIYVEHLSYCHYARYKPRLMECHMLSCHSGRLATASADVTTLEWWWQCGHPASFHITISHWQVELFSAVDWLHKLSISLFWKCQNVSVYSVCWLLITLVDRDFSILVDFDDTFRPSSS